MRDGPFYTLSIMPIRPDLPLKSWKTHNSRESARPETESPKTTLLPFDIFELMYIYEYEVGNQQV